MTVKLAKPLKMMFPSVVDGRYDPKDISREREEWQKEIDKGKVSLAVMDRLQERAENAEAALAKAEAQVKELEDTLTRVQPNVDRSAGRDVGSNVSGYGCNTVCHRSCTPHKARKQKAKVK